MKLKKALTLLLTLMMVLSISACSGDSYPYQKILDAETEWASDISDLNALSMYIAGDFASDEVYTILDVLEKTNQLDVQEMFDDVYEDHDVSPGDKVECKVESEEETDTSEGISYAGELSSAKVKLDTTVQQIDELIEVVHSLSDSDIAASESDLMAETGLTFEEYCSELDRLSEALHDLQDKMDGAKVEKGVVATLSSTYGDEKVSETMEFICIDGKWAPREFTDMLKSVCDLLMS